MSEHGRLADTIRIEGTRILATLVRTVGDLQTAEDAVQEAALVAMRDWKANGVPDNPRAWLTVTARRKAIDILRRESAREGKERAGAELMRLSTPDLPDDSVVRDDQLRLIFTCCHPALPPEAQVALALRTLCGLSPAQIAAVLLTSEAAITKRLTRTRQKIAKAKIPYRVPADADLPARLAAVSAVIHALYTAGHAPASGSSAVDIDVCAEAVRLARLLHELLPDEAMAAAVLALLLLTEARRPARIDASGRVVLLPDQDRGRWDRTLISEGSALLNATLLRTRGIADPYQLQAAIAWQHDIAPSYATTDWPEIVRLYDLLLEVAPSPAAALNRAVAVAEAQGPEAGLAALAPIPPTPRWHSVRAELLARQGLYAQAVEAAAAGLVGEMTAPEREHRRRRRDEWLARLGSGSSAVTPGGPAEGG